MRLRSSAMEFRELGTTGTKVSSLCLGTMTWGDQNSEADGHAQMDYALSRGINFFDTSEMYSVPPKAETQGSTERIIGTWFKARGTRDKVILATKIAGRSPMTWLRDDKSTTEQSPKQIAAAIEASLNRLQTDYIDLYQLHWPDRPVAMFGANGLTYRYVDAPSVPIADILGALDDHVKAGKIRWIGLSNETAWGTMTFVQEAARIRGPRVQSIQNAYSLVNRTFELGLAEIAMREKVGLLAYSPLAQGFLTGKYQNGAKPAGARKTLYNRQQRYEAPQTYAAIDRYLAIAQQFGVDPAQMALQFVTTRPFVTATIIGASRLEQLKSDIDSVNLPWNAEIEKAIDAAHHAQPNPAP